MSYDRNAGAYRRDWKPTICLVAFVSLILSAFFVAAGGLVYLFPEATPDPELNQLYRLYVVVEPKTDNFTQDFQMEATIYNQSTIADEFFVIGLKNTTSARGSGNLLWSLASISDIIIELGTTYPTSMAFYWFDSIDSEQVRALSPSESINMYQWMFEQGDFVIKVQLGPRFNVTTGGY